MRNVFILLFISFLSFDSLGQQLPAKILDRPDGFTFMYDYRNCDTCLPYIFIGDTIQFLFSCANKGDFKRIDISSDTSDIRKLKEIITFDFAEKILDCCSEKHCPDTSNGYFIIIKKGNKDDFVALDIKFASHFKCGSKQLTEAYSLLNKINKKYR